MHIHDFCTDKGTPQNPVGLPVGTDDAAFVKGLRALADRIESGQFTCHGLELKSEIKPDDFVFTYVTITLLEPKK